MPVPRLWYATCILPVPGGEEFRSSKPNHPFPCEGGVFDLIRACGRLAPDPHSHGRMLLPDRRPRLSYCPFPSLWKRCGVETLWTQGVPGPTERRTRPTSATRAKRCFLGKRGGQDARGKRPARWHGQARQPRLDPGKSLVSPLFSLPGGVDSVELPCVANRLKPACDLTPPPFLRYFCGLAVMPLGTTDNPFCGAWLAPVASVASIGRAPHS